MAFVIEAVVIIYKIIIYSLLLKGGEGARRYQSIHQLVDVELKGLYLLEGGSLNLGLADPYLRGQQCIGNATRRKQAGNTEDQ
ncbi:hypothetical protein D3C84_1073440 [compost metagenome]